ncbi:hypothetical protein SAMN05216404_106143 [Nitrosospira multiformis]|uniref:Tip attachment protein J domain-containing protein n=1 Tax=Nitrosospira multiformis TaxID=1231 RepID=A0A1H8IPX0_9PROT|nr:hypothetical protein [Nitrosospira multiformis]SEN70624.1 hypothetical protein SAMN05216404_106143 [Nitrosospira multiformis]
MPPLIPAIGALLGGITLSATTVLTAASIALTVGTTIFGAMAQRAAAKKARRAAAKAREDFLNSLQERTVTRIASDAAHRYVYGRAKVGSDIVAILSSGENEEFKHLVCVHAAHECDGIEKVYIDGKDLGELDADGFVTGGEYYSARTESITENFPASPFTLAHTPSSAVKVLAYGPPALFKLLPTFITEVPYTQSGNTITVTGNPGATHYSVTYQYQVNTSQVRVRKHLGVPGDTADASLLAECPDKWSSSATLTGFCYTVIRLDLRQPNFQGGVPGVEVLLRGKKLYDPRTGTTAWSQNNALVIYDYLTSEMCGVDAGDIPLSHVITAANVCDEAKSFGALYTCNGTVTSDQDQANVLEAMAQSMAGGIVATTWEIYAGKYVAPIASLQQEDIVGALAVTPGISDADTINGVRGQFVSAENQYVATDFKSYQNATYLAADGKDKFSNIDFPFTDTTQRVHNLCRIITEDQRNGFTVKAEFSLKAWDYRVGDRVTLTSAFLGQTDKVYRITDKSYAPDSAITLTLKEDAPSIWDLADTVTLDDTPNTDLPNPFVVQKLDLVTCYSGTDALLAQGDGTIISRILVEWKGAVLADGEIEIQWRRDSETAWRKTSALSDETSAYLSPVVDGGWYVVRARPLNPYFNSRSDWTYADLHQVVGKSEPPDDITDLAIDEDVLSWTGVNDVDLAGYVFRYHFGNNLDWNTAVPLHTGIITSSPYTVTNLPYGSVTIMGKAVDTSGNESLNVGTVFTNLGDAPIANVVETYSFHPTFDGTLTDCTVSGGQIVAGAADSFYGDDAQSFYGSVNTASLYKPEAGFRKMVYESGVMNVGSALTGSKMTLALATSGIDVVVEYRVSGLGSFYGPDDESFYGSDTESFFVSEPDAFDAIDLESFDPSNPNSFVAVDLANFDPNNPNSFLAVDAALSSEGGPFYGSSSAAWLPWPGQVTVKNADYQFRVTIGGGTTQGKIISMTVTIDAPDIKESIANLPISASGTAIPYTKNFASIKVVTFGALQPGASGARSLTIDKTVPLAPVIRALNSSGVAVSGAKVDVDIQGY